MIIKTLIVDDHELVRAGLRLILDDIQPNMDIHEASCAREALLKIQGEVAFDIIVIDLAISNHDDLALFQQIKNTQDCPIVVVSTQENPIIIEQTLKHGAHCYIPKSSEAASIRRQLKDTVDYVIRNPRPAKQKPRRASRHPLAGGHVPRVELTEDMVDVINNLTRRQKEVLELLAAGKTNKEICRTLGLSDGTVKNHVTAILSTLGVNRRTKVALLAREYASQQG